MKKLALPVIVLSFLLISSCGQRKEESAENNKTFSAEQIKAESQKVNNENIQLKSNKIVSLAPQQTYANTS